MHTPGLFHLWNSGIGLPDRQKNNEMEFMKSRGGIRRRKDDFGQNCKNIWITFIHHQLSTSKTQKVCRKLQQYYRLKVLHICIAFSWVWVVWVAIRCRDTMQTILVQKQPNQYFWVNFSNAFWYLFPQQWCHFWQKCKYLSHKFLSSLKSKYSASCFTEPSKKIPDLQPLDQDKLLDPPPPPHKKMVQEENPV